MIDKAFSSVYILYLVIKFSHILEKVCLLIIIYGVINMLKNKIATYSLSAMFMVAAPLAVAVTPGHAAEKVWAEGNVKTIDYETHHTSTSLVKGIYKDQGAWKWRMWPTCLNGGYRFLTVEIDPRRHGIAFWSVQIPKTGFYRLETSYFATENRTTDADYAVYVNKSTSPKPVYKTVINQTQAHGSSTPWKSLGTYCLQENDISMIVLDNMDDSGSASTDASRWTYVGEKYNSERCGGTVNMAPVNHLLLNNRVK